MATPPSPPATPDGEAEPSKGPLLSLLAKGLELWLRQQCQAVQHLEITLEGSMVQLLRGQLRGVGLRAQHVVFQNWSLERVELSSDPIRVSLAGKPRGQAFQLEHPFMVRGSVLLTGDGLSRTLASPAGQELADQLSEQLLGVTPLDSVKLLDERLILRAQAQPGGDLVQVETHLKLTEAGPMICPLDGRPPLPLPMDDAIRLQTAEVRAGVLELSGEALVRP
jgi:hypothetical protein